MTIDKLHMLGTGQELNIQPPIQDLEHKLLNVPPTALEINQVRRRERELIQEYLPTGDYLIYMNHYSKPIIFLTGKQNNLIFQHPKESLKQLSLDGNFRPSDEDIKKVISAEDTIKIDPEKLYLKDIGDEYSFFIIKTDAKYSDLHPERKKIINPIFGKDREFYDNMGFLKNKNVHKTGIILLNPKYIMSRCNEGESISRLSMIAPARPSGSSVFSATKNNKPYDDNRGYHPIKRA